MSHSQSASTQYTEASNGVRYAYRRFGKSGGVPLVHHIHFRGNMDFWDPLLVDTLAEHREVILFDNAGVGLSSGTVPATFVGWGSDTIAFVKSLGLKQVDLFGFSMGGLAVLEAALAAPDLVRKLVIAGSRASVPGAGQVPGIVWPQDESPSEPVVRLASAVTVEEGREALKAGCFPPEAFPDADKYWQRISTPRANGTKPILELLAMDPNGNNQIAAIMDANSPNPGSSFDRLGELKIPVLVMNGDSDILVPASRSWELLVRIKNAQLIIYPKSGHGFLWQYAERVAGDTNRFLDGKDFE